VVVGLMSYENIYIYPTDTVWGIGASIYLKEAQEQIAEIKKTSAHKPLSIIFYDLDEVMSSFHLPEFMDKVWLQNFFSLETTLAVDIKRAKIQIPPWINHGGPMVAFRCVSNNALKLITAKVNSPITTTSLNHTASAPLTIKKEAFAFYLKHCKSAQFVEDDQQILSGHSSTFVKFNDLEKFSIIRKGAISERVERYLGL